MKVIMILQFIFRFFHVIGGIMRSFSNAFAVFAGLQEIIWITHVHCPPLCRFAATDYQTLEVAAAPLV